MSKSSTWSETYYPHYQWSDETKEWVIPIHREIYRGEEKLKEEGVAGHSKVRYSVPKTQPLLDTSAHEASHVTSTVA